MTIGERVRILRKRLHLTQREFSKKAGVPLRTLASLEINEYKPGYRLVEKIASTYSVDVQWLFFGRGHQKELPIIVSDVKNEDESQIKYPALPIVNTVPAGYPDMPFDDEIRYHFYIPNVPKNAFGLIVDGVSMEPELYTGDIVIVNPNQLELKKGEIGVFRYQGGATIKICMPLPGNKGMILQARNPRAESYVVTPDTECTVIGKVIFKIVKCK
jgi:SOS-response transcriptional repressor LexA